MEFLQRDINKAIAKHLLFYLFLSKNIYYT